MAWQCTKCSRFWGRCRRTCPLCLAISERQLCLLKLATSARLPNEVRIMIGESLGVFHRRLILDQIMQVPFNEVRLAIDHTSNNEPNVIRAIMTFKHAMMLVDAISRRQIAESNKLIIDMQKIATCDSSPVPADQTFRSQFGRKRCGIPYYAPGRIYVRTDEKKATS